MKLEDVDIDDPGTARAIKNSDPLSKLDDLYRMDVVKAKLEKMRKTWAVSKEDGDDEPNLGHFVFTGSPGTGKTTVARVLANIFFSLGLLPSDKIVETSGLDLTGKFLGETKTVVNEKLREANGGILFIDEAYNLGVGMYGKEACDTLVAAMTSEKFRDVVIVVAGYPHEIDIMLKSNAGLKSRFSHFFEFPDWGADDCVQFFELLSTKKKFGLGEGVLRAIESGCSALLPMDGWANGRDVTKLWDECKSNRDARMFDTNESDRIILTVDVSDAITNLLGARQPKPVSKVDLSSNSDVCLATNDIIASSTPLELVNKSELSMNESLQPPKVENVKYKAVEIRDVGVTDELWNDLNMSKQRDQLLTEQVQNEKKPSRIGYWNKRKKSWWQNCIINWNKIVCVKNWR